MTALDQAFIKAYVHQAGEPEPAVVVKAQPVPLSEVMDGPSADSGEPAQADVPPEHHAASADRVSPESIAATQVHQAADTPVPPRQHDSPEPRDEAEEATGQPAPVESRPEGEPVGLPDAAAVEALVGVARPRLAGGRQHPLPPGEDGGSAPADPAGDVEETARCGKPVCLEDFEIPSGVCCFEPPPDVAGAGKNPPPAALQDEAPSTAAATIEDAAEKVRWKESPGDACGEVVDRAETEPPPESAAAPFQPAQTDRFQWPEVCRQLGTMATAQVDLLADALAAGQEDDRKVVGMGSLRQGEGCTTLLLSAAARLAGRGLRVVLVEADTVDPQLARRLGFKPRAGWLDVAAGRAALEEAVVQSRADRLTLLPLRGVHSPPELEVGGTAGMAVLRRDYDLLLVDLGPLEVADTAQLLPEIAGTTIDAVVLVQNIQSTSPAEITRLQQRLSAAGVTPAGIAENFVPNP